MQWTDSNPYHVRNWPVPVSFIWNWTNYVGTGQFQPIFASSIQFWPELASSILFSVELDSLWGNWPVPAYFRQFQSVLAGTGQFHLFFCGTGHLMRELTSSYQLSPVPVKPGRSSRTDLIRTVIGLWLPVLSLLGRHGPWLPILCFVDRHQSWHQLWSPLSMTTSSHNITSIMNWQLIEHESIHIQQTNNQYPNTTDTTTTSTLQM